MKSSENEASKTAPAKIPAGKQQPNLSKKPSKTGKESKKGQDEKNEKKGPVAPPLPPKTIKDKSAVEPKRPPPPPVSAPGAAATTEPSKGAAKPPPPPPAPATPTTGTDVARPATAAPTTGADQGVAGSAIASQVPPADASGAAAIANQIPPTVLIPSNQSEDICEFKKKDVVFLNSNIMLFVRDSGKFPESQDSESTDGARTPSKDAETSMDSKISSDDVESEQSMRHLWKLYKAQKLCDLTFKMPDGSSLKLHKVVLTACSKMYLEKFKKLDKNEAAVVTLQDVSPEGALCTIEHLYGKDVRIDGDNVDAVLNCAVQLDIADLVEKCSRSLDAVDKGNVLRHLPVAVKHKTIVSLSSLQKMIDVCVKGFEALIRTNEFLELTVDVLTFLLGNEKMHSLGENVLLQSVALWLNHDLPLRKNHAAQLLKSIRLIEASPKLINELIDGNKELMEVPEIRPLLFDAYRHHALHPKVIGSK